MSVDMKLGRWQARDCTVHDVHSYEGGQKFCWCSDTRAWSDTGGFDANGAEHPKDLVEYLGPISKTPASAEAGPAGASTVSTEGRQEQLQRMKQREAAIWRELEIYLPIVDTMKTALSNLDEEIKRLEKEVEG